MRGLSPSINRPVLDMQAGARPQRSTRLFGMPPLRTGKSRMLGQWCGCTELWADFVVVHKTGQYELSFAMPPRPCWHHPH
jgi:hypothetical protein